MLVNSVVVGQLEVNCYIVSDGHSPEALIIDPGDDHERIAAVIDAHLLKPKYIVFTHAHYDHVCAAGDLVRRYRVPVIMHADDRDTYRSTKDRCVSWGYAPDDFPGDFQEVGEGDTIAVGGLRLKVIHTPGHTPGSICLSGENTLFTGDTLFQSSVGRTDLPGGSTQQLMASLKKLTALPPETRVLCGHAGETTIGSELRSNPYLDL